MALPLIVFFFLIIVAVVLFMFGFTRETLGAGFAFTTLSGVFIILIGLLLWTGGLQLDTTSTMTTSGDVTSITYEQLTFAANPEIQILALLFTFGGFFPIVLSFRNVAEFKRLAREQALEDF